jgi:hypothetical protein
MMLKIHELILIGIKDDVYEYVTNNADFVGKVQIAKDKASNFEEAVKAGHLTLDKWEVRRVG